MQSLGLQGLLEQFLNFFLQVPGFNRVFRFTLKLLYQSPCSLSPDSKDSLLEALGRPRVFECLFPLSISLQCISLSYLVYPKPVVNIGISYGYFLHLLFKPGINHF